ncbi:hypothetical protein E1292_29280 [Nonomuraea deserti]|uniref:Uncharacterized protein n=1 Tax=Nonomuraea deserti TaxID=1848322 RepID=A0A4R4V6J3_9ACTN|nr:hypothetical protein [Nonomuraea deserti]TDD00291.1 hypothetical protein E1292_29280 [Nonomuraea deserti]
MADTASPSGRSLLAAAAGCALAVPVAVWWLVGDLSASVPPGTALDHVISPPAIGPWAERAVGVAALLVTGVTTVLLVRASRRRRFDRRWWAALIPVLVAGAIAGAGWRVVTAGTVGANIGAGLTIMLGGALVALLLLWAAGWSARLLLARRTTR